jgi:Domain of unknown function (DUF1707)
VNDQLSPADGPDEARPELRASHADRDRVVEQLRIAAGDGRLTAEELDERLEAALTARTYRELAILTTDLPAAGSAAAGLATAEQKDVMRFNHRGGSVRQVGRWVVPKRIEAEVTGGNVRLDFTEAVIVERTLKVDAHVRGGRLLIITRPGVVVDADDVATVGGRVASRPATGPAVPTILTVQISGEIRGGNLVVRPPRRTFLQWLRRQPLPQQSTPAT